MKVLSPDGHMERTANGMLLVLLVSRPTWKNQPTIIRSNVIKAISSVHCVERPIFARPALLHEKKQKRKQYRRSSATAYFFM
jgi:hypothetical protein